MPARRICLLLSPLIPLLVDIAAVQAQTWTKHTYATEGFEIEFSGKVQAKVTASVPLRATAYTQVGSDFAFEVGASQHRAPSKFDDAVAVFDSSFKCETVVDTPLRFPGGRAIEKRGINCGDGRLRFRADARYFLVGRWFYQVYALHPLNGSRAGDARRFVESFRVLGQR